MSGNRLTPVLTLAAIDPVARQSAVAGFLIDLPDAVVISYDLVDNPSGRALVRSLVDRTGLVDSQPIELDHDCPPCTLRAGIVATLEMITDIDRWQAIILALPLATDPAPVAQRIASAAPIGIRLAPVVSAIDADTIINDVLGDDLLDERGLAHNDHDRRSVGESVCSMIEYADAIMALGSGSAKAIPLIRQLIAPAAELHEELHSVDTGQLISTNHDPIEARLRTDPLGRPAGRAEDSDGVWTIDLRSDRPLHPQRLMDRLEDLGTGSIRGRGHFWLPTRPDSICVWDGSGGQLSIGDHGSWPGRDRQTRLLITGVDDQERRRIAAAFADVLLTEPELRRLDQWRLVEDGFDPWLGVKESAA